MSGGYDRPPFPNVPSQFHEEKRPDYGCPELWKRKKLTKYPAIEWENAQNVALGSLFLAA